MKGRIRETSRAGDLLSHSMGEVYVLLQMDCELKCKVCPYWGLRGACHDPDFREQHRQPLALDALKRFIDQVRPFHPRTVTLSGGEPLLSDDWVEIAAYIVASGLQVSLSTNALHIPRYYDEIFRYVSDIHVSLGGTKEILSEVRSADFGFDEVVDCLAELSSRKRAARLNRPNLRIIYVVSDLSYRRIRTFFEDAADEATNRPELGSLAVGREACKDLASHEHEPPGLTSVGERRHGGVVSAGDTLQCRPRPALA